MDGAESPNEIHGMDTDDETIKGPARIPGKV